MYYNLCLQNKNLRILFFIHLSVNIGEIFKLITLCVFVAVDVV